MVAFLYPYEPRNIWSICDRHDVNPTVHLSVIERIAQQSEGYSPGNIPCCGTLTETRGARAEGPVKAFGEEVGAFLTGKLSERALVDDLTYRFERRGEDPCSPHSPLDLARWSARVRSVSHYFFLVALVGLAALALCILKEQPDGVWPMSLKQLQVFWDVFTGGTWSGALQGLLAAALLATIIASLAIARRARVRMERGFSEFWYRALPDLRRMLVDRLRPGR